MEMGVWEGEDVSRGKVFKGWGSLDVSFLFRGVDVILNFGRRWE